MNDLFIDNLKEGWEFVAAIEEDEGLKTNIKFLEGNEDTLPELIKYKTLKKLLLQLSTIWVKLKYGSTLNACKSGTKKVTEKLKYVLETRSNFCFLHDFIKPFLLVVKSSWNF